LVADEESLCPADDDIAETQEGWRET